MYVCVYLYIGGNFGYCSPDYIQIIFLRQGLLLAQKCAIRLGWVAIKYQKHIFLPLSSSMVTSIYHHIWLLSMGPDDWTLTLKPDWAICVPESLPFEVIPVEHFKMSSSVPEKCIYLESSSNIVIIICFVLFWFLRKGLVLVFLEQALSPRLNLNSQRYSCLCLPHAQTKGKCLHAQLMIYYFT